MRLSIMSLGLLYGKHLQKQATAGETRARLLLDMQKHTAPVLILTNQITEHDMEFWRKVMVACKISDYAYSVILLDNQIPMIDNSDFKLPKICLLCALSRVQLFGFGIYTSEYFREYRIQNFRLLPVPDQTQLREHQATKRALWASLKQLFALTS